MKVIVNFPTTEELKDELNNRIALFNATLVVEAVKKLDYDNNSKKKVVNAILQELKK